ncbi:MULTISPECIES: hypothetical protein [Halorussus]|uniref:hypothetical protein n=1 Tax=Halorussus TaxID=1070314 RepID=UPI0020A04E85|nr:hypothetical protein [Halorussus vallis]USZ76253.1 hypothetical protein NGM07_02750 [Halorussus vallis]
MKRSASLAFALLGFVLGAVGQIRNLAPALFSDSTPRSLGFPMMVLGFVLFFLSTVVVAAIGYWAGSSVDLSREFAGFTLTAGVVGGLGFLVGGAAVLLAAPLSPADTSLAIVFGVGYNALTKAVSIGLLGLAGASVAHFRGVGASGAKSETER